MLTEDKISEIYSIADDFCKVFDIELEKSSVSDASNITICNMSVPTSSTCSQKRFHILVSLNWNRNTHSICSCL